MNLIQYATRLFYPRGSVRRVLRGPLRGMKFHVVSGMGVTYAFGIDVMHLKFLSAKLRPGMVVYDIGANCGQMALFFSRQAGSHGWVLSFEPVPENHTRMIANAKLNNLTNVQTFECAVGADLEPKSFSYNSNQHTMGTFTKIMKEDNSWEQRIIVPCTTLDEVLNSGQPAPDLIKIDVEGSGLEVISGALNIIESRRPFIYFEIHAGDANAPELQALRLLRDHFGYHLMGLDGLLQDELQPMWGGAVWCEPNKSR